MTDGASPDNHPPTPKNRRRYSSAFKAKILAECDQPGASVAGVAIRHQLNPNMVQKWRLLARRTKTDAADADALVLADSDKSLHPIPIKPEELQALPGVHRIREQWKRARVARICEARALLAEFGISTPAGVRGISRKLTLATEQAPMLIQPTPLDLIQ
jgi:transposase